MSKISLLIFSIPLLFSCSTNNSIRQQLPRPSGFLFLDSLVCTELSENVKGIGSGDDEVLTLVYLATKKDKDGNILPLWESGIAIFSESKKTLSIGQQIQLPENWTEAYLVIILIEQDSYLMPDSIAAMVPSNISFTNLPDINKDHLQKALGDDDLLDAKAIRLKDFSNNKPTKTKLWGIHLFDRYEYWLHWHLE
jgi:hypothetical protein